MNNNGHAPSLLCAALRFAEMGYPVFPCHPGTKQPATEHGHLDATTDPEQIKAWWSANPAFNIGINAEGLLIVDLDPGCDRSWIERDWNEAPSSSTPRHGCHYYFRRPSGKPWRCSASRLAPNVDVRTDGGYVLAPPSVVNGVKYSWFPGFELGCRSEDLPDVPPWLAAELDRISTSSTSRTSAETDDFADIEEGHRDTRLASMAGSMRRAGFDREQILAALSSVSEDRCKPPLAQRDVEKIARSICRYRPDAPLLATIITTGKVEQEADSAAQDSCSYQIILRYFHSQYGPRFRRGTSIYSEYLGREVKPGEATFAATPKLIDQLALATDAPRDKHGGLNPNKLPGHFRTWAPVAWQELAATLPEEQQAEEITPAAEEEFRTKVQAGLFHLEALGYGHKHGREQPTDQEVQRRPLIEWCNLFAKPGRWQSVRPHVNSVWCRRDDAGLLQVAVRKDLFGQIPGCADIARLSQNAFSSLCEKYQVGTAGRAGGERAVELSRGFIAEMFLRPDEVDASTSFSPKGGP
jgi:hypothetical protein